MLRRARTQGSTASRYFSSQQGYQEAGYWYQCSLEMTQMPDARFWKTATNISCFATASCYEDCAMLQRQSWTHSRLTGLGKVEKRANTMPTSSLVRVRRPRLASGFPPLHLFFRYHSLLNKSIAFISLRATHGCIYMPNVQDGAFR